MTETAFYVLAALTIAAALAVIFARNPVHSALSLVMTMFLIAVAFAALDAHLVAALQIVIYAGAVMVLFLFVIMLLNLQVDPPEVAHPGLRTAAVVSAAILGGVLGTTVWRSWSTGATAEPLAADFGTTVSLGRLMFRDHVVAFEMTSLLLLVAVVGAVVLARGDGSEEER